ncbi:MAG: hypothetical protein P8Y70_07980 [Candidatus Lokiarchaeota archaeon]
MEERENNKLKVDIFVPLDACACNWEQFMNLVFKVLVEYRDTIDYKTKNLNSKEARKLNLNGNSVVIDGKEVISSDARSIGEVSGAYVDLDSWKINHLAVDLNNQTIDIGGPENLSSFQEGIPDPGEKSQLH